MIGNSKGGVGKTSVTKNLSFALFQKGKRVLMIDLDSQADLTTSCGVEPLLTEQEKEDFYTISRLMDDVNDNKTLPPVEEIIRMADGVDFIPSSKVLTSIESELGSDFHKLETLKRIVDMFRPSYDFILMDMGPKEGGLVAAALAASDYVIIPTFLEKNSMKAVLSIMTEIRKVPKKLNPNLKIMGVLISLLDLRTKHSKRTLEELKEAFGKSGLLFKTAIPVSVKQIEAMDECLPVGVYDKRTRAALAFDELAQEVISRSKRKGAS